MLNMLKENQEGRFGTTKISRKKVHRKNFKIQRTIIFTFENIRHKLNRERL